MKRSRTGKSLRPAITPELCDTIVRTLDDPRIRWMMNPVTNHVIKTNGSTYLNMMRGCFGCQRDMDECERIERENINPFTNRRLRANSVVKRNILRGCASCEARELRNIRVRREEQKRRRSAALERSHIDLEDDEVMAFLHEGLQGREACPQVISMSYALNMVNRFLPASGIAVIHTSFGGSAGHYAAMRLYRDTRDRFHIEYYEPFGAPFDEFIKPLRALVDRLNRDNGKNPQPTDLEVYPLGWQRIGGPCGAYAAYATRALLNGSASVMQNKKQAKSIQPSAADINAAYAWIAKNAPAYD